MSTTIKQVALRTGLSVPTVGNILNRADLRYNAETRRRVLEAARDLGYRPNSSARAVRQGRFGCAALVLGRERQRTRSALPQSLIDGLDDELASHDMHLTVSRLSDADLCREEFIPKVLRQHMADGIIVYYTHEIPGQMIELIHAHHAPAVWLNAKLDADCVYFDDHFAAKRVTEHLLSLGHRRVALLHLVAQTSPGETFAGSWRNQHYSVAARATGYAEALAAAGRATRIWSHDRYINERDHRGACLSLLSAEDRPTAVLAYSELEALSVVVAAASLGLRIPEDLSIVMFAAEPRWVGGHQLSVAEMPIAKMGHSAVQMLRRKLLAPHEACAPEVLPYELGGGNTVAAASGSIA
jgi:LacI family transcriptional regulator